MSGENIKKGNLNLVYRSVSVYEPGPKINKPTVKHKGQGSGKWEPILRFITEDELAMLNTRKLRRLNKFIDIDVFAI